jgi:hypothetical protein
MPLLSDKAPHITNSDADKHSQSDLIIHGICNLVCNLVYRELVTKTLRVMIHDHDIPITIGFYKLCREKGIYLHGRYDIIGEMPK